jgi:hypothetical protein
MTRSPPPLSRLFPGMPEKGECGLDPCRGLCKCMNSSAFLSLRDMLGVAIRGKSSSSAPVRLLLYTHGVPTLHRDEEANGDERVETCVSRAKELG